MSQQPNKFLPYLYWIVLVVLVIIVLWQVSVHRG